MDVACGTGLVTFPAAEQVGPSGEVIATDISDKMIEYVHERADQLNLRNVSAFQMDAEDLRVEDDSFDVSICALGLMYTPDPEKAIQEMYRSTKSGGRAVAAVWGERKNCGWAGIFPVVDSRVKSDVCPMFFQLGTGDILKSLFEKAGFSDVKLERISAMLQYDSGESACGAAFAGGPVALPYSKFDDTTKAEAFAEYLATIEPFRDSNGYNIPGEFVVVVGTK
jgi:ubiquinone/menaquinone biosynthesis C-methylase UbiE